MLKNTKDSIDKIKRDLTVIKWIIEYGLNILLVAYLAVAIILEWGNLYVNIALVAVAVGFMIANAIFGKNDLSKKEKKEAKQKLRSTKRVLRIVKIIIKAYSLGVSIYGMYVATSTVSPLSIILTTLLIVVWVISVIIEIIRIIFDYEKDRLFASMKKDFEWYFTAKQFVDNTVDNVKKGVDDAKQTIKGFVNEAITETKEGIENAKNAINKVFGIDKKDDTEQK